MSNPDGPPLCDIVGGTADRHGGGEDVEEGHQETGTEKGAARVSIITFVMSWCYAMEV